jgi:hypothetical protein
MYNRKFFVAFLGRYGNIYVSLGLYASSNYGLLMHCDLYLGSWASDFFTPVNFQNIRA